ncbi:hypothetical protein [Actinokineospora sp. HUAS TT18]|uniref:hypothetical protein n=1 Tax=Actinokineospora sp. HUAS TT18 TaxID=3447451 RepID=UPI003F51E5E3
MGDSDRNLGEEARAGYRRLLPAVTFGVRAAALAGLVITAGAASAGALAGAFDDPAALSGIWPTSTTCCPEDPE